MTAITVEVVIDREIKAVWKSWNDPADIVKWNQASENWHCPKAVNDFKVGDTFWYTMASKDGQKSYNFEGLYSKIENCKLIKYTIADGRKVTVNFEKINDEKTKVREIFEAENVYSEEDQRKGWQAILDSFKNFCEDLTKQN